MWAYQKAYDGACYRYDDVDVYLDPKFKAARVFSLWAIGSGGILMFTLWFSSCVAMSLRQWAVILVFLALNCVSEGLMLLLMTSAVCDPAYGICR